MIITMQHVRAYGGKDNNCAYGTLKFLKRYGLDYRRFFKIGLPDTEILKTRHAIAVKIVEAAKSGK